MGKELSHGKCKKGVEGRRTDREKLLRNSTEENKQIPTYDREKKFQNKEKKKPSLTKIHPQSWNEFRTIVRNIQNHKCPGNVK